MLTLNKILRDFADWQDVGPSYDDPSVTVYSGDLWALAECFTGEPTDSETLSRLQTIAESKNVELRFYDETIADNSGRVHNTTATHWGWTPTYAVHECGVWARDEAQEHCEDYAAYLIDNDSCADQFDIDFSSIGFKRWAEIGESGLHRGQTDTPGSMRQAIEAKHGQDVELIFYVDSTGQFDVHFGAWYRKGGES